MEEKIDITDHLPRPDYTAAIAVPVVLILLSALVGVVVYYRRRAKQEKVKRDIETADLCMRRGGEDRLRGVNFTDAQWAYVEHTLLTSEEDLEEFDLSKYDRSEEGFLKLQKVVKSCRKAQLRKCKLTEKSCEVLASVLTSNSRLTELDLIDNELCDSRVKKLCTGLQSPNCKLQKLR
ncbi:NACHT, LRR and PYD domains-containing protein 7-like [Electrophorus electricus]|uniref:NACHT, LRR and PYD domains-containing protein 7-like n=1 Tax=Electrophorus electricus TaxID=8005 RepID=UPI0015D0CBC2|nr:NACHT, LRR and PYD domains-containing protein 7-like [Electrophorus electricus]